LQISSNSARIVDRRGPNTLRNLAKLSHVTTYFLLLSPAVWSLSSSAVFVFVFVFGLLTQRRALQYIAMTMKVHADT